MTTRILVPYDGSLHSHCALLEAATRAERDSGSITLLAIPPAVSSPPGLAAALRAEARADLHRRYQALLWQARAEVSANVSVHTVVREGAPADTILSTATESGQQLIVMGSRSRGRFHSLAEGRVARAVRMRSAVPVVLIPAAPWRERHWFHAQRNGWPPRARIASVRPRRAAASEFRRRPARAG